MRACFLFSSLVFYVIGLSAQDLPEVVKEIVAAENHFAKVAQEKSTRDAFVEHLADSSIVFVNGAPARGQIVWAGRQADESLLHWWPVFSEVAASGDFGYNTGPFEWSKDRRGSAPLAYGYFSSVWKKEKGSVWKVIIDMGMETPGEEQPHPKLKTSKRQTKANTKEEVSEAKSIFLLEDRNYIGQLNRGQVSFLVSSFSQEGRLHHTGHFPVLTAKRIAMFDDSGTQYHFEQLGGDIAASGDMAYAYGNVSRQDKASKKHQSLNYLRIWKKEDGKNWKIVLDVIGG